MKAEFRLTKSVRTILTMLSVLALMTFALVMNASAQDIPHNHMSSNYDPTAESEAIRAVSPDQLAGDLNAVADYVAKLPAANGKVAAGGFCWGGSTTFLFATRRPTLKAAFVFYGSAPGNNAQGQPYAVDKAALA